MPSTINGAPAGTTGDDTFTGTAGNDVINMISTGVGADGGTGRDVAFGGDGNDRIISDGGDIIYGGSGIDIADLRLQNSTANFVIDISQELAITDGTTNGLYDIGDHKTLIGSIEQLYFYGGSGDDLIKGGAYADRLDGGGGHNSIYGGGGADQIFGHNGDVTLDGGSGADVITIDGYVAHVNGGTDYNTDNSVNYGVIDKLYITGLAGYDSVGHVGDITNVEQIWVNAGLGPVTFSHDTDPQTVSWAGGGTTPAYTAGHQIYVTDVSDGHGGFLGAQITGSEYGDTIRGGQGDDVLIGNKGNDTLYGGDGNDTLQGGVGGDHIFGGAGNDTLWGGTGDDFLFGGAGVNQLDGKAGTDTAVFLGHAADFTFSVLAPGIYEADNTVTGEHDKLTSIENVQFDGGGASHPLSDYIV